MLKKLPLIFIDIDMKDAHNVIYDPNENQHHTFEHISRPPLHNIISTFP